MVEILMKIIMGVMLLLCGVQDVLKKKILLWLIIMGSIFLGICVPFCNTLSLYNRVGGITVGAFVIIVSLVTQGKIGMGDGMLLCATGIGLGFWSNLELFAIALFLAAVVSIVLLAFRLADRKKSIPFVPFLLIGYIFLILGNTGAGV